MLKMTLPDGSVREVERGISVLEFAKSISEGLARACVGADVNGEIKGMPDVLEEDGKISLLKFEDKEGKQVFWHTSAHLMAYAVQRLFPDVKFAIGPSIDQGFYYDFDTKHRFVPEDLEKIEEEMKKIVKENPEMIRKEVSKHEALQFFLDKNEKYKVELIQDLPEDSVITMYQLGEFVDLCRGPHMADVRKIKAIKLMSIAGAYWRGDEKNEMLQRIYAITFEKKKDLDEYLERLEEAKRRDHRKIGQEMRLFTMHEEGPGFPFFHPKGMVLRNILENFWREAHAKEGYGEIRTPIILNESLWRQSGHWDHYKENMYFTKIDENDYAIKPMNCPGSILVYKSDLHSYRDFPIKLGEMGLVHRHELSGALHGLFRVRSFTQDDAHIFCLPSQIKEEVTQVIRLANSIYSVFGFKYKLELSTQPENSMGTKEQWDLATESLRQALEANELSYEINEGDGAFYGPKIDYHLEDAIGRTWQCGTIQLDFQMPERFDITYIDKDNEKKRPVMIHRALLGSMERFMGILIEHYAGKFPAWLAPVQVKILSISEKFNAYAMEVYNQLKAVGIRVELDDREEKIGYKVRNAQMEKVPYSLVVGEKEMENKTVAVRKRDGEQGGTVSVDEFIQSLIKEIEERVI